MGNSNNSMINYKLLSSGPDEQKKSCKQIEATISLFGTRIIDDNCLIIFNQHKNNKMLLMRDNPNYITLHNKLKRNYTYRFIYKENNKMSFPIIIDITECEIYEIIGVVEGSLSNISHANNTYKELIIKGIHDKNMVYNKNINYDIYNYQKCKIHYTKTLGYQYYRITDITLVE